MKDKRSKMNEMTSEKFIPLRDGQVSIESNPTVDWILYGEVRLN